MLYIDEIQTNAQQQWQTSKYKLIIYSILHKKDVKNITSMDLIQINPYF